MSDKKSKQPTHKIYNIDNYGEGKTKWTEIGVAWSHEDDEGLTVKLNYMPCNDQAIVIRKNKPKGERA